MQNIKIIDSENLVVNVNKFKNKKICAMVKANAYGHGLKEIVKIVESHIDYFGVANIEEACAVRKICEKPVLICAKTFDYQRCRKNNIDVMIDNEHDLLLAIKNKNSFHLKIDSGMNRYGVRSGIEMEQINKILTTYECEPKYIYTHFQNTASALQTKNDYKKFQKLYSKLEKKFPICFGGSGIYDYDFDFQMIRLGISMYGYGKGLFPVEQIVSYVCKIFFVRKGEAIGYSGAYKAKENGFYAIVPVGYADGIPRNLSGNFSVSINNKKYKAVGNVCMDSFFVKIDESVKVGDEVIVMNDANELAKKTIVYEILTGFSNFRGRTIIK